MMTNNETTAAWQWEQMQEEFEKKSQSTEWAEVLADIEINSQEQKQMNQLRSQNTAKGDNLWVGDDMHKKLNNVGCRLITTNAAKKMNEEMDIDANKETGETETTTYTDYLLEYMKEMAGDIMVVHEPGQIWETQNSIRAKAKQRNMSTIIKTTRHSKAAGVVIVLSEKWQKIESRRWSPHAANEQQRVMYVEFKAKERKKVWDAGTQSETLAPLEKMMIATVYGFNNPSISSTESNNMWTEIFQTIDKYRKENTHASVIIIGDLNAAKSASKDTNRVNPEREREKDAFIIEAIEGKGIIDTFRHKHPNLQAWTREPSGELSHIQAARRIDYIMGTQNIATHLATRTGIHEGFMLDSDHKPVIMDIPLDAANIADRVIPTWLPYTDTKIQMDNELTDKQKEEFNNSMEDACNLIEWETMSGEDQYKEYSRAIKEAAENSISTTKQVTYPRPVKKLKHYMSIDMTMRTWKKRTDNAIKAINNKIIDKMHTPFKRANFPVPKVPEQLGITSVHLEDPSTMDLTETKKALENQKRQLDHFLKPRQRKARAEKMRKARKRRDDNYKKEQNKGMGNFLNSVFKTMNTQHNLAWARREDGTLADTPEEVGELVRKKFEAWFSSIIPMEERWGDKGWEAVMELDTTGISKEKKEIRKDLHMSMKDFAEEVYLEPEYYKQAEKEGWWLHILKEITCQEINDAVKATKAGTAPGESQVAVDMLKHLEDPGKHLVHMFNTFLQERRIPDTMNTALLRLLPKTDEGLSNLDKTRPIALMETICKLYERVIITRVTKAIEEHNIIDPSQYGAIPKAGTAPPLRVLTEVMEDARLSESELHIIALDLKKAFDTCEYWSQAMSWRALGMPEEAIKILINLDAGSNSPGDKHEGPGASTRVILDAGRKTEPFTHGRGVRQGSVGGPIKWVVFMHFWLTWIKRKMKGKGYHMSAGRNQVIETAQVSADTNNQENKHPTLRTENAEMIAQMFIDDSIWTTSNASNAQELLRRCEMFCDFHGIIINKDKSEYIAMNHPIVPATQVRWIPKPQYKTEQERKEKIARIKETMSEPESKRHIKKWLGKHNPLGTVMAPKGKTGKVRRGNKRDPEDGRTLKYLGVQFQAQQGWRAQIESLNRKHEELMANLKFAKITVEQAVTAINVKVIPAMMYPLQVATIPQGILKNWDRAHRRVINKAGGMASQGGMPPALYHIPKEYGGIGLISLRDRVDRTRIMSALQAKNDSKIYLDYEELSTQAKITKAAQTHENNRNSLAGATREALERYNMKIIKTPTHMTHERAMEADREQAKKAIRRDEVDIYTDGATIPGSNQKTAWGMTTWYQGREVDKAAERLHGEQSNDIGEAMALLQALRRTHPETRANIFIDNAGVVQTVSKDNWNNPRGRQTQGGRAVWNRIHALLATRNETNIQWIHSHVDSKERRKWKENNKMVCACGGQGKRECDPEHQHHKGNERADKLAGDAIKKKIPKELQLQCLYGDETYHLVRGGIACQGNSVDVCNDAIMQDRIQDMQTEKAGKKANEWASRYTLASMHPTKNMASLKDVSTRFRVRMWVDNLPTYKNEAKKCQEGGIKHQLYGDSLEGGKCRCCHNEIETMHHLAMECQNEDLREIRDRTKMNIDAEWNREDLQTEWEKITWMDEHQQYEGWKTEWAHTGMVPEEAYHKLTRVCSKHTQSIAMACIKETAAIQLKGTQEIWAKRNEIKQGWEKEVGIDTRRAELGRQQWKRRGNSEPGQKGKMKLPITNLKDSHYKETRMARERLEELTIELGAAKAREEMETWTENRKVEKRLARAKTTQGKATIQTFTSQGMRYPRTKSKTKQLSRHLRRYPKADTNNTCTAANCDKPAVRLAMGCRRRDRRCQEHYMWSCRGKMTRCSCQTEENKTTEEKKQAEKSLRQGDWIAINTDDGWVEGELMIKFLPLEGKERTRKRKYIIKTGETATHIEGYHIGGRQHEVQLSDTDWWKIKQYESDEEEFSTVFPNTKNNRLNAANETLSPKSDNLEDSETDAITSIMGPEAGDNNSTETDQSVFPNTQSNREDTNRPLSPKSDTPQTSDASTPLSPKRDTLTEGEEDAIADTTNPGTGNYNDAELAQIGNRDDRERTLGERDQNTTLEHERSNAAGDITENLGKRKKENKVSGGYDHDSYKNGSYQGIKKVAVTDKNRTGVYKQTITNPTLNTTQYEATNQDDSRGLEETGRCSHDREEGQVPVGGTETTGGKEHMQKSTKRRSESMDGTTNRRQELQDEEGEQYREEAQTNGTRRSRPEKQKRTRVNEAEAERRTESTPARHPETHQEVDNQESSRRRKERSSDNSEDDKPHGEADGERASKRTENIARSEGSPSNNGSTGRGEGGMENNDSSKHASAMENRSAADSDRRKMDDKERSAGNDSEGRQISDRTRTAQGSSLRHRTGNGGTEGGGSTSNASVWNRHGKTIQGQEGRHGDTRHDACSEGRGGRPNTENKQDGRGDTTRGALRSFQPGLQHKLEVSVHGSNTGKRKGGARRERQTRRRCSNSNGEKHPETTTQDTGKASIHSGAASRLSDGNSPAHESPRRTDPNPPMLLRIQTLQAVMDMDEPVPTVLEAAALCEGQVQTLQTLQRGDSARGAYDATGQARQGLQATDTRRIHEEGDEEQNCPGPGGNPGESSRAEVERVDTPTVEDPHATNADEIGHIRLQSVQPSNVGDQLEHLEKNVKNCDKKKYKELAKKLKRKRATARERGMTSSAIWALVAAGITQAAVTVDLAPNGVFWQSGTAFRGALRPPEGGPQDTDTGGAEQTDEDKSTRHRKRLEYHRKRRKVNWKQKTLDGREFDSQD